MVIPEESASMANTFRHAYGRFAQYWNTEFRTSGHLWQNRYYSCAVEERAVGCVMAYVENNPVRAGMARCAEDYVWSSARAHLSGTDVAGCLDMNWWRTSEMQPGWSDALLNAGCARRTSTPSGGRRLPGARWDRRSSWRDWKGN
jgi:putative transposase